jgi:hypothetical protein
MLVVQLLYNFPAFYETHGSLPYSQEPSACPYPESSYHPILFLENSS